MAVVRIGVAAFIFFSSFERQLRIAGLPFIFFKCFFQCLYEVIAGGANAPDDTRVSIGVGSLNLFCAWYDYRHTPIFEVVRRAAPGGRFFQKLYLVSSG